MKKQTLYPHNGKLVEQKEYLSLKKKEYSKKYKGIAITESHLKHLLKIAQAGESLVDETPAEHKEILADFEKDIALAREKQQEDQSQESAKENKEIAILEFTLSEDVDFSQVDSKFKVSPTGVVISEDATEGEIGNKLRRMLEVNEFSMWAIGDLGNALQDRGYEDVILNMCSKTQLSASTVYRHMAVSRSVPQENRTLAVLPSVIQEIVMAKLSDKPSEDAKLKEELLKQAETEKWDSKEARSHASAARQTPKQKKGKTSEANFLVIEKEVPPYLLEKEPEFDDEVIVINIKNRTLLDMVEEGENSSIQWVKIPTK